MPHAHVYNPVEKNVADVRGPASRPLISSLFGFWNPTIAVHNQAFCVAMCAMCASPRADYLRLALPPDPQGHDDAVCPCLLALIGFCAVAIRCRSPPRPAASETPRVGAPVCPDAVPFFGVCVAAREAAAYFTRLDGRGAHVGRTTTPLQPIR